MLKLPEQFARLTRIATAGGVALSMTMIPGETAGRSHLSAGQTSPEEPTPTVVIPSLEEDTIVGHQYEITANPTLNVRSGPGTEFGKVATLKKGEIVTVIQIKQDGQTSWFMIGPDQWISSTFTKKSYSDSSVSPITTPKGTQHHTVATATTTSKEGTSIGMARPVKTVTPAAAPVPEVVNTPQPTPTTKQEVNQNTTEYTIEWFEKITQKDPVQMIQEFEAVATRIEGSFLARAEDGAGSHVFPPNSFVVGQFSKLPPDAVQFSVDTGSGYKLAAYLPEGGEVKYDQGMMGITPTSQ